MCLLDFENLLSLLIGAYINVSILQDATGATLVSQENSKIILYRGWPDGEERPKQDLYYEEEHLTPELRDAMITEEGMDERFFEGENDSDWDEEEDEDDNERQSVETTGSLNLEDDSDVDEEEDEEEVDVISGWQEDSSVTRKEDGVDQACTNLADSDGGDFKYEDDTDDDVDFEWNEVEDGGGEDDEESHRTSASQSVHSDIDAKM